MTVDTKALRVLAEKATRGPWAIERLEAGEEWYNQGWYAVWLDTGTGTTGLPGSIKTTRENAAYIAALSPDVVLALLDEVEGRRA